MKKKIALTLTVFLLLGTAASCLAEIIIIPRYSHTSAITAVLSFSGGNAVCSGSIKPSGSYNASVTVTLYKENGSKWDYVTSWSGSAKNGSEASASGSKSVGSGTYKVTTSGAIKDSSGTVLEAPSKSVTRTK
ncbi:MAG: hypothetical protein VB099_00565 [Candidatus Limiplasma sp.]|nr:hypothetical protein [Candidatus Limiplasma sp.]